MLFERLECRELLSTTPPFGAQPDDTGEYMLGKVAVTVVLMESDPALAPHDANSYDWSPGLIQGTKTKIEEGLNWWEQMVGQASPAMAGRLDFVLDYTYADQPVHTGYEPINQRSDFFQYWMYDFLNQFGFAKNPDFQEDMRVFNNSQRLAHGTDWAFTMFVVNSADDPFKTFATGGSFSRAFSYPGGSFMVVPSGRPASTFAHETGHQFWALDEYLQTDSVGAPYYTKTRGYYNTQNVNAPYAGSLQQESIMAADWPTLPSNLLTTAYTTYQNAPSTLQMVGWKDSDGDGIFDVLDVPHTLTGTGFVDAATNEYRFVGTSAVQPLINRNPSGLQNDITLNAIDRAEYRIDGGVWQTAAQYHTASATLDLRILLPDTGPHSIEIRTVDDTVGVASPVFQGSTGRPTAGQQASIGGFVWNDTNSTGQLDSSDARLSGWKIQVLDANSQPLATWHRLEPDDYAAGTLLNTPSGQPQVTLTAIGGDTDGRVQAATRTRASTGSKVFGLYSYTANDGSPAWTTQWTDSTRQLKSQFSTPVSKVELDAVGIRADSFGRLEAYDANGQLLARYTTSALGIGAVQTMVINRPQPDIAYVIARGHKGTLAWNADSSIHLDNLRFGIATTAVTDTEGVYAVPGLLPGTYRIQASAPYGDVVLTSALTTVSSVGSSGASVQLRTEVNLASSLPIYSWQNASNGSDVNGDGHVSAADVLSVINYVNAHPQNNQIPASAPLAHAYVDVDGNGYVNPSDVLILINVVNQETTSTQATVADPGVTAVAGEGESLAAAAGQTAPSAGEIAESAALPMRFAAEARSGSGTMAPSASMPAVPWQVAVDQYFSAPSSTATRPSSPRTKARALTAGRQDLLASSFGDAILAADLD